MRDSMNLVVNHNRQEAFCCTPISWPQEPKAEARVNHEDSCQEVLVSDEPWQPKEEFQQSDNVAKTQQLRKITLQVATFLFSGCVS